MVGKAVKVLLNIGCDVNAVDKLGFTPLHLALKSKQSALANRLLQVDGVQLDVQTRKGFTPLMIAAWKGDIELCSALIEKGADLKVKTEDNRNVWGVANDHHHEEILHLLKKHGLQFEEGDEVAFPPHPKWRAEHRDKNIDWDGANKK